jgi:hypothetical protein
MQALGFNILYSAPASFKCIPVEYVFGTLKKSNLEKWTTPTIESEEALRVTDLSLRQKLLSKVAEYLINLNPDTIKSFYRKAF